MTQSRMNKKGVFGDSEALKRVTSPDDLDSYIKLSDPNIWLVLGGLFILLLIGILWCFTGNILTTTSCKGIYNNGTIYAYVPLENAAALAIGQDTHATIGENTIAGTIVSLSSYPLNQEEASKIIGNAELAKSVVPESGGIQAKIACDEAKINLGLNALSNVEIVLSDISPIDLMLEK